MNLSRFPFGNIYSMSVMRADALRYAKFNA